MTGYLPDYFRNKKKVKKCLVLDAYQYNYLHQSISVKKLCFFLD